MRTFVRSFTQISTYQKIVYIFRIIERNHLKLCMWIQNIKRKNIVPVQVILPQQQDLSLFAKNHRFLTQRRLNVWHRRRNKCSFRNKEVKIKFCLKMLTLSRSLGKNLLKCFQEGVNQCKMSLISEETFKGQLNVSRLFNFPLDLGKFNLKPKKSFKSVTRFRCHDLSKFSPFS